MLYIAYMKFSNRMSWARSLKDRRQVAQRARDQVKTKYNASVKLKYGENINCFDLYIVMLADDRDYLLKNGDEIDTYLQNVLSLAVEAEVDIEAW